MQGRPHSEYLYPHTAALKAGGLVEFVLSFSPHPISTSAAGQL